MRRSEQAAISTHCIHNPRMQRSTNLVDWEDWKVVPLDGNGCEITDSVAPGGGVFYRAVKAELRTNSP